MRPLDAARRRSKSRQVLAPWIALELSEGRDPWDATSITQCRVLYCLGEMWRTDLEELIPDCGHDPLKLANFHATQLRMRLDTQSGAGALLARVDQLGPQVVILDGLNGFVDPLASENTDNDVEALRRAHRRSTQSPRHSARLGRQHGQGREQGLTGQSVKNDKADGVVAVRPTDSGVKLHVTLSRAGAYLTSDLNLEAEGFDRSRPIRYWRSALGSYPAGTNDAVALLDSLGLPHSESRRKVQIRLRAEIARAEAAGVDAERFRFRTEVLNAAVRFRRTDVIRASAGTS